MKTQFAALLASVAAAVAFASDPNARVHRSVHRALAASSTVDLIVTLRDNGAQQVLDSFNAKENDFATRGAMITALKTKLEAATARASEGVTQALAVHEAAGLYDSFQVFWISNQISFKGATLALVEKLAALPGVAEINEELVADVAETVVVKNPKNLESLQGQDWGLQRIQATRVWADGTFGHGVVIGSIDTGVLGSHEVFKGNFVGPFGWYDPEAKKPAPYDLHGPGTHAMGVMVGAKGVGVAPGAKWMACKGCRATSCPQSDLIACAQFMLCPTDTDGKNADCSKAPRVVSNSWGTKHTAAYKPLIDVWEKAGIVPVFPVGTKGPACGTVQSPADYPNVIGVGTTNPADATWDHSARGPSADGLIKPDISAPGTVTRSAFNANDTDYQTVGSNSVSAGMVAGTIALLLSHNPHLTTAELKATLVATTDRDVTGFGLDHSGPDDNTDFTCGNTTNSDWPNNQFGHGILNAFSAYQGFRPAPTPVPTTRKPTPTTPVPTTPAPATTEPPKPTTPVCATPSGLACGSDATGPGCCPTGEYCQPWNPSYYQCRPAAAQCSIPQVGVDFYGDDLATIKDILPWECCDRCAATVRCQAYTFVNYNADGHAACYLKRGSGERRALIGAVSATVKTVKPKCSMVLDVDFNGNDLRRVDAVSAEACCDVCATTRDCKGFTFVDAAWDKQSCYLKTSVKGEAKTYSGAVSGVLN